MGTAALSSGVAGMSARGHVWSKVDPSSSLEAQVDALTKDVERVNERLTVAEKTLDSQAREHADALRGEQQVRAEHDAALKAGLEAAETGGLHISFVGVIWLLFGLLLSSVPREIAQLLH